jgi:hypothetical protein
MVMLMDLKFHLLLRQDLVNGMGGATSQSQGFRMKRPGMKGRGVPGLHTDMVLFFGTFFLYDQTCHRKQI